jgi:hypothetical protein
MTSPAPSEPHLPDGPTLARKAHRTLEPLHVIGYFAPEPTERVKELGVKGGMRAYFAMRSAPLGRVPAEVVVATFFNFAPEQVAKAIPSVWEVTTPEAVSEARYAGIDAAYRRSLGDEVVESAEMAEAAALAREATAACDDVGRALYAAHAALPWPEPPHLQLFHAQTLLREHRGDAHVAALMLAGLDGIEALVGYVPLGQGLPESLLRATRGWPDEAWDAAARRLRDRGLLDGDGDLTAAGRQQRDAIEAQTDLAAAAPYLRLGAERTDRLRALARPWSRTITEQMFGGGG